MRIYLEASPIEFSGTWNTGRFEKDGNLHVPLSCIGSEISQGLAQGTVTERNPLVNVVC